jgi:hypothetical protein
MSPQSRTPTAEQQEEPSPEEQAQQITQHRERFLGLLLERLDASVEKRWVRTCVRTIVASVLFRNQAPALNFSELGSSLIEPAKAPAGTNQKARKPQDYARYDQVKPQDEESSPLGEERASCAGPLRCGRTVAGDGEKIFSRFCDPLEKRASVFRSRGEGKELLGEGPREKVVGAQRSLGREVGGDEKNRCGGGSCSACIVCRTALGRGGASKRGSMVSDHQAASGDRKTRMGDRFPLHEALDDGDVISLREKRIGAGNGAPVEVGRA